LRTNTICTLALVLALAVAGCGGGSTSGGSNEAALGGTPASSTGQSGVLRIPYLADMSVPDPDIFYDIEGNSVILNAYEGLLRYAPGSTKIVGGLAAKWTESTDGLTYTFTLRKGVKFHDGSPLTAQAVIDSFKRRLEVAQAPAYMLQPIKTMKAASTLKLVLTLKHKVDPFLAYMASSWGPKIIGPEAIKTHAGKDFGQTWLRTHDDGTGPYKLTGFDRGRQYTLTRFDGYWGAKPDFHQILIKITPDIGTQRLELQNGDLDAVMHSFPASELSALPANVRVIKQNSFLQLLLYVNTNKAPFNDPAVRAGLRSALNVNQLVSSAYSGTATKASGAYPPGILPSQPALPYAPNPSQAKAAVAKATTKAITLAYTADESGVQRRASELLQAQLQGAGLKVTLKEVTNPQVYDYVKDLAHAPDLLLMTNTPDAAHPDTWARILFYSSGGLNFLGFKDGQVDKDLDQAVSAPPSAADKIYEAVGKRVIDSNAMFFLGNVKNVFVVNKDLGDVQSVPAYPWTLDLAALKKIGS
jgi:peptide/nickel transport system substrate-binding protein